MGGLSLNDLGFKIFFEGIAKIFENVVKMTSKQEISVNYKNSIIVKKKKQTQIVPLKKNLMNEFFFFWNEFPDLL